VAHRDELEGRHAGRRRLWRTFPRRRARRPPVARTPTITVVVAAGPAQQPFLDQALVSVRRQTHTALEILIVPYDASSGLDEVHKAHRSGDSRVRVLDAVQGGPGAAWNAGAQAATGDYLALMSGADVLPRAAMAKLCGSLQASGSDFAVGRVALENPLPPSASPGARLRAGAALTLADLPEAATDSFVQSKLFRLPFWREGRLAFPVSEGPAISAPMLRAYLQASSFDVLPDVTYRWMQRGTGRAVGHEENAFAGLEDWLHAQEEISATLDGNAEAPREAWMLAVLDGGVAPFLDQTWRADHEQWQRISSMLEGLMAAGGAQVLSRVRVVPRLKAWLAAHDRRADLEAVVADRGVRRESFATEVSGGAVRACLPFFRDPAHPVPDEVYRLGEDDTPLVLSLRRQRWVGPRAFEMEVFAFIALVSMDAEQPLVTVSLVDRGSGDRLVLPVALRCDGAVNRFAGHAHHDYQRGALTAVVDAALLAERARTGGPAEWEVEVSLTSQGITREAVLEPDGPDAAAANIDQRPVDGALVGLALTPTGRLIAAASLPHLRLIDSAAVGRRLTGRLTAGPRSELPGVAAVRDTGERVEVPTVRTDGVLGFSLELPRSDQRQDAVPQVWRMEGSLGEATVAVAWSEDEPHRWLGTGPGSEIALRRTREGQVSLVEVARVPAVDTVRLAAGQLTVRGVWLGTRPESWSMLLRGRRVTLAGDILSDDESGFEVRFRLRWDEWGLGESPVPTGRYRLVLTVLEGDRSVETPVLMTAGLEDRAPEEHRDAATRVTVRRTAQGSPQVSVQPAYQDDELGRHARKLLQSWYASPGHLVDDGAVYLQSYTGDVATDSPLAIHEELRRVRPDLRLYWGVSDAGTRLPPGAIPLLMHSREWYAVLARARYLVCNVDLERWWRAKPGQRFLQTFHGYPSKSMGIRLWRAKQFSPRRIASELARTSAGWDTILTPAPEMDEHYRREYDYDGPILSHGYPRDDALVAGPRDSVRARTRELLGIDEDQTVVLYAPTWRDDLATTYRSAPMLPHLDVRSAHEELGEQFVLLVRGHRIHAPDVRRGAGHARVLDVTRYPEVNHLILAADAAVLDYSSLRFDFALTGRPMIFLVPDLESYTAGARGLLFDYRDSAPGPLVRSSAAAVDSLKDLDGVRAAYADAYERFNSTYNYRQDGRSAQHVVAEFFGPASEPPAPHHR
jgi:CDP-glycerol glycerophosphotransferase